MDRMHSSPEEPKGWPEEAKRFLESFYTEGNATTTEEKVRLLESRLGGQHNIYATQFTEIPDQPEGKEIYGKDIAVPLEAKQAALEHELLEQEELINPEHF